MQNSLFVKKNSILLSLAFLVGFSANNSSALSFDTISNAAGYVRRNSGKIALAAAVFHASTTEAEQNPYSVLRPTEPLKIIKDLIAAKQYKAATYIAWTFFRQAGIGYAGKPAGISVAGSSLAIKGENCDAGSIMKDGVEYHLFEKKPVKAYGIVGCSWAKAKQIVEVLEGITKTAKVFDDFGKLLA